MKEAVLIVLGACIVAGWIVEVCRDYRASMAQLADLKRRLGLPD
ncbi:hypothetical protein ABT215_13015 [Streptomyces sp900105755]